MTHAFDGDRSHGGSDSPHGGSDSPGGSAAGRGRGSADGARDANLLGAFVLAVAERLDDATREAAASGGAAPAALVALESFLDGSSIDTLRKPLGLTHSAAVRLVDRLVAAGLVRREPGADARSVAVFLTGAGRQASERVQAGRMRALADVLSPLDAAEREQLARLHERLLGGLTSGRADARHICRLCDSHACGHERGLCPVTRAADRAEAARAADS
ncbi:MAG: MarR family transcriptional regulator [Thermoleophilaceae bacterium]|nr:MarR family transcriptional regulator [Thermoleophilaceae bacterium]